MHDGNKNEQKGKEGVMWFYYITHELNDFEEEHNHGQQTGKK